jgi:cob(I)alamin adenosyltransferase
VSIVTKTGDEGTTGLMYNRRVLKCHPRVEAYGAVDEVNSALGLARASSSDNRVCEMLAGIQKDLIIVMGELATALEDLPRYVKDGFQLVSQPMVERLEVLVGEIEARQPAYSGWATPGANMASASLDVARSTCRRAERKVCGLHQNGQLHNPVIIVYLNRLADLLWLLARLAETPARSAS